MRDLTDGIRSLVEGVKPRLLEMTDEDASARPEPGAWSAKETLGHLVDSATNNVHRFVRGARDLAADFPGYQQDDWVRVQKHNARRWTELVDLWSQLNLHIAHVVDSLPVEALAHRANVGLAEPWPLAEVARDYVRHMKHHLAKLVGDEGF